MVGAPGATWHLELVDDARAHAQTRTGPEDLLVLYLDTEIDSVTVDRLLECVGARGESPNPYWQRWGVTVADPDGYRLVLRQRGWG